MLWVVAGAVAHMFGAVAWVDCTVLAVATMVF